MLACPSQWLIVTMSTPARSRYVAAVSHRVRVNALGGKRLRLRTCRSGVLAQQVAYAVARKRFVPAIAEQPLRVGLRTAGVA